MTRKMATIRKIDAINPIAGADAIEVATVGGWKVVVKKGEFTAGDLAVYCEIDSWIPTGLAPFLSKGKEPREYNGVKGERLRTVKLRGQVSQGLLLPTQTKEILHENLPFNISFIIVGDARHPVNEGEDVSELLGIRKWEAPIPAQLAGVMRGSFPSFIRKTDQERIQNLKKELEHWNTEYNTWEVTEKLDGSSMTVYFNNGVFGVCSRNIDLVRDENNAFWKTAISAGLEKMLTDHGANLALQGELVGEGIQGNPYGLTGQKFYLYNIFNIDQQEYLSPWAVRPWAILTGVLHVPLLEREMSLTGTTIDYLLDYAEGKSALNNNVEREGVVFKRNGQNYTSFKAISNKFLMGEK